MLFALLDRSRAVVSVFRVSSSCQEIDEISDTALVRNAKVVMDPCQPFASEMPFDSK